MLPRREYLFAVIDDAAYSSENILGYFYTFDDARIGADKYRLIKDVSITGLGAGIIYNLRKLKASAECPICGISTPHNHSEKEIQERKEWDANSFDYHEEEYKKALAIARRIEDRNKDPLHSLREEALSATPSDWLANRILEAEVRVLLEAAVECERTKMFPGGWQESLVHHGVEEAAQAIRKMASERKAT